MHAVRCSRTAFCFWRIADIRRSTEVKHLERYTFHLYSKPVLLVDLGHGRCSLELAGYDLSSLSLACHVRQRRTPPMVPDQVKAVPIMKTVSTGESVSH
jgi:hypothetical protein